MDALISWDDNPVKITEDNFVTTITDDINDGTVTVDVIKLVEELDVQEVKVAITDFQIIEEHSIEDIKILMLKGEKGDGGGASTYADLPDKPRINGYILTGNKTGADLGLISEADLSDSLVRLGVYPSHIMFDTTANWTAQTSLVSEQNAVYVYTDYQTADGHNIAGIKVGDGLAYVVDLPFLDTIYARHIQDEVRHITQAERAFWNNKNRAYMSLTDAETLVLTAN